MNLTSIPITNLTPTTKRVDKLEKTLNAEESGLIARVTRLEQTLEGEIMKIATPLITSAVESLNQIIGIDIASATESLKKKISDLNLSLNETIDVDIASAITTLNAKIDNEIKYQICMLTYGDDEYCK